MAKKPVILHDYTEDAEREEALQFDPRVFDNADPSYIPGYSEIVQANDIEKANDLVFANQHEGTGITKEYVYTKILKTHPRKLPVIFRWLRVAAPNGTNSYNADRDRMDYTKRGYRIASVEDLDRHGFGRPPAAHVEADGTIRRDDVALFVVDGGAERAYERWLAQQIAETENPTTIPDAPNAHEYTSENRDTLELTTME
jgi:hypothetical protein